MMQMYGNFEGFLLEECIFWVGNIMTSMIVKVFGQQIENSLTWGKNPRKKKTKHMGNLLKLLDVFFFPGRNSWEIPVTLEVQPATIFYRLVCDF